MKKLLFLVTALLAMVQQSSAQTTPVITVADVEALPGETVAFSLNLTGGKVNLYASMQFDVQFPATGFTTTGAYTVTSEWPNAISNVGSVDGTGLATIPVSSSETISAADVENLMSISFNVANTVAIGEYDVTIKNLWLGYNKSDKDYLENVTFKVKVVERHTVVLDELSTTAPTAATGVDVTVNRTINANEWSTICLPFGMTEAQCKTAFGSDVQIADFTGYDTTKNNDEIVGITVNFQNATAIEANHPYLIKVTSNISEFAVENVNIAPEDAPSVSFGYETGSGKIKVYHPVDFNGTYVADFDFYTAARSYPLFLSGNKFYYATKATKHMKAFRAYFDFDDYLAEAEVSGARVVMSFDDEPTDVKHVTFNIKQNTGEWYTLDGRKLDKKPTAKGVYVKDGRKVVIK